MVYLSGLAAHEKPRIWGWQPVKSLDYKFLYAFICQVFSLIDDIYNVLIKRRSLTRLDFQLQVVSI